MSTPSRTAVLGFTIAVGTLLFACQAFANYDGFLLPQYDGAYSQWSTSTGTTTHYTMVDEQSCDGIGTYNFATTTGFRDSYGISLSAVPNGATITQIDIQPCASRNTVGSAFSTAVMNVFYRWTGASGPDAGAYSLVATSTPGVLATTTFSGLSFTKTATSTLEIGAVYSSGTDGVRLSQIEAFITYTP